MSNSIINANLGMAVLVSVVQLCSDDRGWRILNLAGLPLPGSQVRVAGWFNLDKTWAVSIILVGALSLAIILANEH